MHGPKNKIFRKVPDFMEPVSLSVSSEKPNQWSLLWVNSNHYFILTYFFKIKVITSSILHLDSAGISYFSDFSTEILQVFVVSFYVQYASSKRHFFIKHIIWMVKTMSKIWWRLGMNYEASICFWFVSLMYILSNTEVPPLNIRCQVLYPSCV